MSKTLILMRHAKSSWDDPLLSDHARPLNKRGRQSADRLGDWLRQQGHLPDQALVSSSARTRETWDRLGLSVPAEFADALYHAGPDVMMQALRRAKGDTVLMLGHNPGIAEFAHRLVASAPTHDRFLDYPTGATLVARFPIPTWTTADWHSGAVTDFVVPREL